jgi:hypothetical protein
MDGRSKGLLSVVVEVGVVKEVMPEIVWIIQQPEMMMLERTLMNFHGIEW